MAHASGTRKHRRRQHPDRAKWDMLMELRRIRRAKPDYAGYEEWLDSLKLPLPLPSEPDTLEDPKEKP